MLYPTYDYSWYSHTSNGKAYMGGRLISLRGGEAMEVYQALSLMFMFGMFIIALLNYLKKK
ncbi:putative holin-like toxin [Paenibacillus graminis]